MLLLLSSLLITIFTPIRSLPFIPLPLISTLYLQFTSSFPFYFFLFPNIFLRSPFIISISFLFFFCSFFQLYFSTVFLHSEQIISSLLLLLFPTLCTRSFRPYLSAYLLAFFYPFLPCLFSLVSPFSYKLIIPAHYILSFVSVIYSLSFFFSSIFSISSSSSFFFLPSRLQ